MKQRAFHVLFYPAEAADAATAAPPTQAVGKPVTRVLPQYETVSIDDEEAAARTQLDYYKGRKNVTDRLAVLDLGKIAAARQHYDEAVRSVLCRSTFTRQVSEAPDGSKLVSEVLTHKAGCCERLGESSKRFAVPVLVYTTNPKGDPLKPLSFLMKVWRFGPGTFQKLQQANKEHPLATHDVKVVCKDDQYQNVDIVVCGESIFAHPKFQAEHGASVQSWIEAVRPELKGAIGRDMSDDEIAKKLGEAPGAAVAPEGAAVSSLDDLLGAGAQ